MPEASRAKSKQARVRAEDRPGTSRMMHLSSRSSRAEHQSARRPAELPGASGAHTGAGTSRAVQPTAEGPGRGAQTLAGGYRIPRRAASEADVDEPARKKSKKGKGRGRNEKEKSKKSGKERSKKKRAADGEKKKKRRRSSSSSSSGDSSSSSSEDAAGSSEESKETGTESSSSSSDDDRRKKRKRRIMSRDDWLTSVEVWPLDERPDHLRTRKGAGGRRTLDSLLAIGNTCAWANNFFFS